MRACCCEVSMICCNIIAGLSYALRDLDAAAARVDAFRHQRFHTARFVISDCQERYRKHRKFTAASAQCIRRSFDAVDRDRFRINRSFIAWRVVFACVCIVSYDVQCSGSICVSTNEKIYSQCVDGVRRAKTNATCITSDLMQLTHTTTNIHTTSAN